MTLVFYEGRVRAAARAMRSFFFSTEKTASAASAPENWRRWRDCPVIPLSSDLLL
jgi:hypothetical protein